MKQLIIIAIALVSTNAFATRARVMALGNSPHLVDTQTVYSNPADMMVMGDYVTFESGITGAGAEGSATGAVSLQNIGAGFVDDAASRKIGAGDQSDQGIGA